VEDDPLNPRWLTFLLTALIVFGSAVYTFSAVNSTACLALEVAKGAQDGVAQLRADMQDVLKALELNQRDIVGTQKAILDRLAKIEQIIRP